MKDPHLAGPLHRTTMREQWGVIEPHIDRLLAVDEDLGLTKEKITGDLAAGNLDGWLLYVDGAPVGFVGTFIRTRMDGKRVVQVAFAAGGVLDWVWLLNERIEEYAHENGCVGIEVVGRIGWGRALRDLGFRGLHWTQFRRVSG